MITSDKTQSNPDKNIFQNHDKPKETDEHKTNY